MDVAKLFSKAEEAIKRRNFDYAIMTLRNQILKADPNDVKARQLLRAATLEKYKINGYPSVTQIWSKGLIPRVKMLVCKLLKKWETVVEEAENFLEYDPKNISALHALGEACIHAKYIDTAVAVLEMVLAFENTNLEAIKALGRVYRDHKQDLVKAQECFQRANRLAPADPEAGKAVKDLAAEITAGTYGKAKSSHGLIKDQQKAEDLQEDNKMLRTAEDYAKAIDRVRRELENDPNNKKQLRRLAELFQGIGDYDQSIDTLNTVLQLDPTSNDVKQKISEAKIQKIKQRVQNFTDQLKQKPNDESLKQQLERAKRTELDTEIQEYGIQVKDQPTNYDLRFRLARALMQASRYDEAITHLQISVGDPRHKIPSFTLMGQAFSKKKEFDLAVEQFKNALQLQGANRDNQYKDIMYSLALAYEAAGKNADALQTYTTIYKEDINYRDVQARLKKLKNG